MSQKVADLRIICNIPLNCSVLIIGVQRMQILFGGFA